ncbi:MAG: hypothetical protein Faunusvirus2_24 [Faunusvirus sp.]|jgi:ankyrin repeat protein|uniref:Uncharacterized protein n=1 Tax=Faunusvirus sp. TaxID=2487766 RepID=A0A3G4ZW03_9VIRU|nr:MAG: hypothetical protein Faunusvirus2_24 [Faunusvirus sp.]
MTTADEHAHYLYYKLVNGHFGTSTEDICLDFIDQCGSNNFYDIKINYWNLLSYACYLGYAKVAFRIMDYADINLTCEDGWTPLMCAVVGTIRSNSQIKHDIVKELIRRGADVNYKSVTPDSEGFSALSVACSHRDESMVITLIKAGAHFVDIMNSHIYDKNVPEIEQCIRDIYHEQIIAVINTERTDETSNNAMAASFRTTYAVELVGIIAEFII